MLLAAMQGLALLVLFILLPYYLMFMSGKARLVSSLPGPTPLPFIGNALEIGRNGAELLSTLSTLRQQYGNFARLWLGPYLVVGVADPVHAEPFLTSKTNITKSLQYKFIQVLAGKGLLTSTGDKWRSDRKLINPAFSYKILEEFLNVFNSQASVLTQKLKKEVGGPQFDVHKYLLLCALDISCESSMGVKMNIQDDQNNEYLRALSSVETCIVKRCMRPWLYFDFIFNLTELGKELKASLKIVRGTAQKIIQRRKREFLLKENESEKVEHENEFGHKKKTPFLDLLLQHEREGYFTDQDIQDQVGTFLLAGHDTVATSSGFCLWLLAHHPQCQEKAYDELNTIFGDSDREATSEDMLNMKYLDLIMKETMRLYPAVPICLRELDEEVKIDGYHLLPGTTIGIAPFFIHRHPDYFPEPEKFDPDRFSPERSKGRHPYAYVPFSSGPRNCIGRKYGVIGMKAIVSKILRAYKVLPGTIEPVLTVDLFLKSTTGIHIKLEKRKLTLA